MAKQSILKRMTGIFKAQTHGLLDSVEDPRMALEQNVRDYANSLNSLEQGVAQSIGNLRMLEHDQAKDIERYHAMTQKAQKCLAQVEKETNAGNHEEAVKYNKLAKQLVTEQMQLEKRIKANKELIDRETASTESLKTKLENMQRSYNDVVRKKDELVARASTAEAMNKVHKAVSSVNGFDPTSDIARLEAKIRKSEATVIGHEELSSSTPESQFAALENLGEDVEVQARLAALKSGSSQTSGYLTAGKTV